MNRSLDISAFYKLPLYNSAFLIFVGENANRLAERFGISLNGHTTNLPVEHRGNMILRAIKEKKVSAIDFIEYLKTIKKLTSGERDILRFSNLFSTLPREVTSTEEEEEDETALLFPFFGYEWDDAVICRDKETSFRLTRVGIDNAAIIPTIGGEGYNLISKMNLRIDSNTFGCIPSGFKIFVQRGYKAILNNRVSGAFTMYQPDNDIELVIMLFNSTDNAIQIVDGENIGFLWIAKIVDAVLCYN